MTTTGDAAPRADSAPVTLVQPPYPEEEDEKDLGAAYGWRRAAEDLVEHGDCNGNGVRAPRTAAGAVGGWECGGGVEDGVAGDGDARESRGGRLV